MSGAKDIRMLSSNLLQDEMPPLTMRSSHGGIKSLQKIELGRDVI